jgi:hypothetical protein
VARSTQHHTDPRQIDGSLIAFGSHAAPEAGMPVQPYVGFGDRDLDLTGERGLPYGLPAHARSRAQAPILVAVLLLLRTGGRPPRAGVRQRLPISTSASLSTSSAPAAVPWWPAPWSWSHSPRSSNAPTRPARPNSPTWRRGCGATPSPACSATGSSPTSGQTPTAAALTGPQAL